MVETIFCITTGRSAVQPAGGAKQRLQQRSNNNLHEQFRLYCTSLATPNLTDDPH